MTMATIDGFKEYVVNSPADATELAELLRRHREDLFTSFILPLILQGDGEVSMEVEWFDGDASAPLVVGLLEDGSTIRLEVSERPDETYHSVIATTFSKPR